MIIFKRETTKKNVNEKGIKLGISGIHILCLVRPNMALSADYI